MNQKIIPDNNLPVLLQRYDIVILNNKEESVGNVLYTTVGAVPSNKKGKRVWSLKLTGYLKPNVDKYNIVYDFSEVDYKSKEDIRFENIISGTFTICGRVLDASKIIGLDYKYNDKKSTLTIELDTSKLDFRLKKEVLFSYDLNVDDSSSTTYTFNSSESERTKTIKGATFTISSFSETSTSGEFKTTVSCSDSSSSSCTCPGDIYSKDGLSNEQSTLSWTTNGWTNLTEDCEDSTVSVEWSDIDTTAQTITIKWVSNPIYTFNSSESERTKTIKGATFTISSFSETSTPGVFITTVLCSDSSSSSCTCQGESIYSEDNLSTNQASILSWTTNGWTNLTEDCEDSTLYVEWSDIDTTAQTITIKWVEETNPTYTFNSSESERTKTIKGATFTISFFSETTTPGLFKTTVLCSDSSSSSCTCPGESIYSEDGLSNEQSTLSWTRNGWTNLTEDCEDSSVSVQWSDLDKTAQTITMKWVSSE